MGRGHLTNRTGAIVHQVVRGRKGNLAQSGHRVKKANQALLDPLVLRGRQVVRAWKVLLALQVLPIMPFELYASTRLYRRCVQRGVQPERGTYDRVLRSPQNSCDPYQRKNSHLSKDREYKPSRHGLCEGGVIEKAELVDADVP